MSIDMKHAAAHASTGSDPITTTADTWTASQTFRPSSASTIGTILKMLASQTADALQVQDSAGTPYLRFAGKPLTINGDYCFLVTPVVSTSAPAAVYVYRVNPNITNNDASSAVIGAQIQMDLGTGTAPAIMIGQQIYNYSLAGSAVNNAEGVDIGSACIGTGSYIGTLKDVIIKDVYLASGGYCSNHYGIFIQDLISAGVNYAIWTGLGKVHLGDAVEMTSGVTMSGLPTSAGGATGTLWNDSGTIKIN